MCTKLGCHRGMVGPERGLRPQKDPLWLDLAAVRTRPANRPAIPADALDAIPMFKDKPTTDEEQEQCTRQLSAQVGASLADLWSIAVGCSYGPCILCGLHVLTALSSHSLCSSCTFRSCDSVLRCVPAPNFLQFHLQCRLCRSAIHGSMYTHCRVQCTSTLCCPGYCQLHNE